MNIFAICNNRTQNPLAPLTFFAPALAVFLFAGCRHRAEQPPLVDQQEMRSHVVGAWAESHGTNENLQFNDDGTLQMDSPREHHTCAYDFPDAAHIRLNCSPAGAPPILRNLELLRQRRHPLDRRHSRNRHLQTQVTQWMSVARSPAAP